MRHDKGRRMSVLLVRDFAALPSVTKYMPPYTKSPYAHSINILSATKAMNSPLVGFSFPEYTFTPKI